MLVDIQLMAEDAEEPVNNSMIVLYMIYTTNTIQYIILEGESLGEFGELQGICQNFLVQNFFS